MAKNIGVLELVVMAMAIGLIKFALPQQSPGWATAEIIFAAGMVLVVLRKIPITWAGAVVGAGFAVLAALAVKLI